MFKVWTQLPPRRVRLRHPIPGAGIGTERKQGLAMGSLGIWALIAGEGE
jgi:hypothetical protein